MGLHFSRLALAVALSMQLVAPLHAAEQLDEYTRELRVLVHRSRLVYLGILYSVLAALLAETQPWQDIGDERLLQRYQRARREETAMLQITTDSLRRLFRQSPPGLRPLRNWGLNLTNALPFVKNALVRYALGAL